MPYRHLDEHRNQKSKRGRQGLDRPNIWRILQGRYRYRTRIPDHGEHGGYRQLSDLPAHIFLRAHRSSSIRRARGSFDHVTQCSTEGLSLLPLCDLVYLPENHSHIVSHAFEVVHRGNKVLVKNTESVERCDRPTLLATEILPLETDALPETLDCTDNPRQLAADSTADTDVFPTLLSQAPWVILVAAIED